MRMDEFVLVFLKIVNQLKLYFPLNQGFYIKSPIILFT